MMKGGSPSLQSEVSVGALKNQPRGLEWPPMHLAKPLGPDGAFELYPDSSRDLWRACATSGTVLSTYSISNLYYWQIEYNRFINYKTEARVVGDSAGIQLRPAPHVTLNQPRRPCAWGPQPARGGTSIPRCPQPSQTASRRRFCNTVAPFSS